VELLLTKMGSVESVERAAEEAEAKAKGEVRAAEKAVAVHLGVYGKVCLGPSCSE
jgi:hypothetical protein